MDLYKGISLVVRMNFGTMSKKETRNKRNKIKRVKPRNGGNLGQELLNSRQQEKVVVLSLGRKVVLIKTYWCWKGLRVGFSLPDQSEDLQLLLLMFSKLLHVITKLTSSTKHQFNHRFEDATTLFKRMIWKIGQLVTTSSVRNRLYCQSCILAAQLNHPQIQKRG